MAITEMWHWLGGQDMTVPWDIRCSWGPAWHCGSVSCISASWLLGFSQGIKCLQIRRAA